MIYQHATSEAGRAIAKAVGEAVKKARKATKKATPGEPGKKDDGAAGHWPANGPYHDHEGRDIDGPGSDKRLTRAERERAGEGNRTLTVSLGS
jgi:hypothetical protein